MSFLRVISKISFLREPFWKCIFQAGNFENVLFEGAILKKIFFFEGAIFKKSFLESAFFER